MNTFQQCKLLQTEPRIEYLLQVIWVKISNTIRVLVNSILCTMFVCI